MSVVLADHPAAASYARLPVMVLRAWWRGNHLVRVTVRHGSEWLFVEEHLRVVDCGWPFRRSGPRTLAVVRVLSAMAEENREAA